MSVWQSLIRLTEPSDAACPPILVRDKNLIKETEVSCPEERGEVTVSSLSRHCCQRLACTCHPPYQLRTGDLAAWRADRLYWQGRTDNVVKVQGTKVSLEHVENVLSTALATQVVCAVGTGALTITAFVQSTGDSNVEVAELFERSRKVLSSAEMPGKFTIIDNFPLSHHGKLDRRKLALMSGVPASLPHSTTYPSQLLYLLWTKLLGYPPQPADNFIAAGGDSFLAVGLVQAITDAFPSLTSKLFEVLISCTYETIVNMLQKDDKVTSREQHISKRPKLEAVIQSSLVNTDSANLSSLTEHSISQKNNGTKRSTVINRCKGRQNVERELITTPGAGAFRLRWKVDFEKCIDSSPLYVERIGEKEGLLVVGSHSGWVKAVHCISGHELWATRFVLHIQYRFKLPYRTYFPKSDSDSKLAEPKNFYCTGSQICCGHGSG
jgi:hypothetical protein